MRYFVGIDPASESFVASVFTVPDDDLPGAGPREFENTPDGFDAFQSWLTSSKGPFSKGVLSKGVLSKGGLKPRRSSA